MSPILYDTLTIRQSPFSRKHKNQKKKLFFSSPQLVQIYLVMAFDIYSIVIIIISLLNIHYPIHLIYYLSVYLLFIFSILFFFVATVIFLSFFCFFFIVVKTTAAIFLSEILLLMSSFYLVETAPGNSTTFHYPLRHVQLLIKSWFKVDIRLHLL